MFRVCVHVLLFQIQIMGWNSDVYANRSEAIRSPHGLAMIGLLVQVRGVRDVIRHVKYTPLPPPPALPFAISHGAQSMRCRLALVVISVTSAGSPANTP